jgi:hypothetical protein
MTDGERLSFVPRIASLVRTQIENNGGVYDGGSMAPNIQSIIDVCVVEEKYLKGIEKQLIFLEKKINL